MSKPETTMAPGLRPMLIVLCVGQVFAFAWMSGQYSSGTVPAADRKSKDEPAIFVTGDKPTGKFWGNDDGKKAIDWDGTGTDGKAKAISIRLEGAGWRGCGFNWKGWYPADAGDNVSKFRSLVFHIRQVTTVPDADLIIQLVDNIKRSDSKPASNGLSVVQEGRLSRIDGEWRKVVLPLDKFAKDKPLDLNRIWGIDFSDTSGRQLAFQVDRIGFADDCPPLPKFPLAAGYSATATVDFGKAGHSIPDQIYGACDLTREQIEQYGIAAVRWGGNRSSRFNWKINADNAGRDWFFKNGGHPVNDPADGGWVKFARLNHNVGAASYTTVPMLGFVAKDYDSHAFSIKKYGAQKSTETGHPDVGDGLDPAGMPIRGNDWRDTSVEASPEFIADGVRLIVQRAGAASPRFWVLDNEPMIWHDTHRDVRPKPLGYEELWDRTVKYAEAIKQADPSAKVAGFCSWGWTDLFYSAADEGGDGYKTRPDHRNHGRLPLAEWFIQKCGEHKKAHGKALIDVFDFHWYPQAELGGRGPYQGTGMDLKFNQLRLRTTGDLWDPAYPQESWIRKASDGKPTMVLRRVREWVERHNPGMQICVGEYNFGGGDNLTGALAQADVFGVLARERADLAFIWTRPEGTQELAWKLFRNYDGAGGRFGDRFLPAESSSGDLSVCAAKRSKNGATTIVVLNKNLGGACSVKLNVPGLNGKMRVWRFDQETECRVVEVTKDAGDINGTISLSLPAASGTMIVIQ
jgi:Glycoside hydrolase family 44